MDSEMIMQIGTSILLCGYSIEDWRFQKIKCKSILFLLLVGLVNLFFMDSSAKIGALIGTGIGVFFCLFSLVTDQSIGLADSLIILVIGLFYGVVFQIYMLAFSTFFTIPAIVFLTIRQRIKHLSVKHKNLVFIPFLFAGYILTLCLQKGWV